MAQQTPRAGRPATERAAAWLYTGPLGHLWSAVADISLLWLRWVASRLRRRLGR